MGRRVPYDNFALIHPFLYLSFFAAGFAASIAIITAICSVGFRRKSSPPPPPSNPSETSKDLDAASPRPPTLVATTTQPQQEQPQIEKTETECASETEKKSEVPQIKELPLPPAMQQPKDSLPSSELMKRATSERRVSFSLSLKMPRTLSVARNWDFQKEENRGKSKAEDSVWMKTIILGGKCVPGEEDPVIYEGKGKRISAYHPKNSTSFSLSRQCSFIDTDAVSVPHPQTQKERINTNTSIFFQ